VIRPVDTSTSQPEPTRRAAASSTSGRSFAALHAAAVKKASAASASTTTGGQSTTTTGASTAPSSSASETRSPLRDARVPKGESWRPVSGTNDYAEITAGPRAGQFVNLSGNARDGMAFSIELREGKRYHVYGSHTERDKVEVPAAATPPAGSRRATPTKAPSGETWAAVSGHDDYADILSGPRNGHYVNLSGNAREGREFLIVRRDGHTYHVYGSGEDKQVVEVRGRDSSA
jgi:hypothetical protein